MTEDSEDLPMAPAVRDRIHALWDELADFDATQADAARRHLLGTIASLIDACNATWIGAVRLGDPTPEDPVKGWRPRAVRMLHAEQTFDRLSQEQVAALEAGVVDATTIANVAGAGSYRVNLLRDLVPADWFKGAYYRGFYLAAGHRDAIWAGVPINEDAECYFGFFRGLEQAPFGAAERRMVAHALRGLRWFHRQQMLAEGVGVSAAPLTPLERRVLQGLLQGLTEKEIAATVAHSPHTTHEYVKRIFRKYGVTSRTALMALWLGQAK